MATSKFISRINFSQSSFVKSKLSEDENHSKGGVNQSVDETLNSTTRASWMSKLSIDARTSESTYDSSLTPQTKPKKFSKFKIYENEELNTISEVLDQEERLHKAQLLAKKEIPYVACDVLKNDKKDSRNLCLNVFGYVIDKFICR